MTTLALTKAVAPSAFPRETPHIAEPQHIACRASDLPLATSPTPDDDEQRYLGLRTFTLRKYGLTPDSYQAMHLAQEGLCAICGQPETQQRQGRPKVLAVDHDGMTGRVRELLCCRCNQALGLFGEDPERLRRAATYIERHRLEAV